MTAVVSNRPASAHTVCRHHQHSCLSFSPLSSAVLQDAGSARYEDVLLRDPYSVKQWLSYLLYHAQASQQQRISIYERALQHLPSSYKIWRQYLTERMVSNSDSSNSHHLPPAPPHRSC
jgi:hypothetical protein